MSEPNSTTVAEVQCEGILTLAEAASLLRVDEAALADMAVCGVVPAQKIGEEWRFLKRALIEWLHLGPRFQELFIKLPPPWLLEYPPFEELVRLLEKHLLKKMESERSSLRRGSKEAVRQQFGVFQKYGDLEAELAKLAALREERPDEDGQ